MPSLYRVAIALLATVVGGAPTFITSPIDRPLVLGLPIIVVSLAYLLTRIGDRRPVTIDLVCATLLAAPGIACHSWLSLRGSDATNWYFPELRVLGVIEQSGAGAATIGILWSGAIALLALRGRRSLPSAVALFAGGAWLGLGTLLLKQLVYVLYHSPPQALIYALAAVNQWQIGALFGALLVWTAAARVQPSLGARIALAVFAAILTAACTVPVVAIAHMVDLAPLQTELQQTPPGPRGVGIVYDAPEGASAEALTILLQVRGQSTKPDTWTPNRDRKLPWHRALRLGLVVAVPPSTTRADLDALARVARQHGALRIELSTRATGLPPGVMNTLLGWPTVGHLLD
ncbi:MAG TPA: hypothetical protein DFR83_07525, partial [Deltaproteobacteria bacterium]|nr:hypothetical protein [Deltaproteobacteria bacterium]